MKCAIMRGRRGQGLPEYALLLALVAIVSVAALYAFGLLLQRSYGVVGGALGGKDSAAGKDYYITITSALCQAQTSGGKSETGMLIQGETNAPLDRITIRTTKSDGLQADGGIRPIEVDGAAPRWKWSPFLSQTVADTGLCPISIAAQVDDGAIAISPIRISTYP